VCRSIVIGEKSEGSLTFFGAFPFDNIPNTMKGVLASYNAAPHNRYQPHPAEPKQYTKYSNTVFVLLKMGIMMPETC